MSAGGRFHSVADDGLLQCAASCLLVTAYRWRIFRPLVRFALSSLEGGMMRSRSLRRLYSRHEGVEIGAMSRGDGIQPGVFPRGTKVGRFSCFARGLQVLGRNHPPGRISQHPLFFNHKLGGVASDTVPHAFERPLTIGNDVWTGWNVIILPGCKNIGDGAIIGAGAVVTKDVPAFSIVGGNPARLLRERFPDSIRSAVEASRWWDRPLPYLLDHMALFAEELTEANLAQFRAAFPPWSSPVAGSDSKS